MILGTFFDLSAGDITIMIGHMKNLFSDLSLYILLVLGVGIGLIVILAIISAIRR